MNKLIRSSLIAMLACAAMSVSAMSAGHASGGHASVSSSHASVSHAAAPTVASHVTVAPKATAPVLGATQSAAAPKQSPASKGFPDATPQHVSDPVGGRLPASAQIPVIHASAANSKCSNGTLTATNSSCERTPMK